MRAAGLVPVGVCNASHDVLKTASEQGLPEVRTVALGAIFGDVFPFILCLLKRFYDAVRSVLCC